MRRSLERRHPCGKSRRRFSLPCPRRLTRGDARKGFALKMYPGIRFVVNQTVINVLVDMFTSCVAQRAGAGCTRGSR